jgi:Na+/H+-dicarboxylate symporter
MKLWIRLLVGCGIGVALGLALPESGGDTPQFFAAISDFVIHLGRYFLFPVVLFGILIGAHELREDRATLRVYGKTLGLLLAATAVLIILGTVSVLVLSPARIPPIFQEAPVLDLPSFQELVYRMVPTNLFAVFSNPGEHLFPIVLMGFLVGIAIKLEEHHADPLVTFCDAASRVFYRLNSFAVEVLSVAIIAVAASFVFELRAISDFEIYSQLFTVLLFDALLVMLVIVPLLIYFLMGRENPFVWLFAMVPPILKSVFSGDIFFATPTLIRAGKENLGIQRRAGSAVFPLAAVLGRAGTAMVASASFVLILRSYTALEITFVEVIWVMTATFGFSLLLGSVPGSGVIVALSLLSGAYGRGMGEVYLILRPVTVILVSIGVLLDALVAAFVAYLVAYSERMQRRVHQLDFM